MRSFPFLPLTFLLEDVRNERRDQNFSSQRWKTLGRKSNSSIRHTVSWPFPAN